MVSDALMSGTSKINVIFLSLLAYHIMQRGIFYIETDRQSDRYIMHHYRMYDRIMDVSVVAGEQGDKEDKGTT